MLILAFFLFAGAVAGILSGLLGIGGGVIVVPTLAYLFQYAPYELVPKPLAMHMAVASSLMAILLTSIASARAHQKKGSLRWDIWKRWVVGLCLGSMMGAWLVTILSAIWLRDFFAIFLLCVVVKLVIDHRLPKVSVPSHTIFLFILGIVIGVLSGLLGVGGGILMMPVLISLGCSMPESAGTSSASMVPLAFIAGIGFMLMGHLAHVSVAWSTGYIYWPAVIAIGVMGIIFAPIGAKLSYKLPALWIKRLLAVLLFVIAVDMLV